MAQAALESGWGESLLARQGKNLFGVKADPAWRGEVQTLTTREFLRGAWVTVIQGAIFVICVVAFRAGIVGEIGRLLKTKL